jgi:hypothetical protein
VTPLRVAADAAWAEVESLRQEVLHALTLDDTSPACQAHTDEAYAPTAAHSSAPRPSSS